MVWQVTSFWFQPTQQAMWGMSRVWQKAPMSTITPEGQPQESLRTFEWGREPDFSASQRNVSDLMSKFNARRPVPQMMPDMNQPFSMSVPFPETVQESVDVSVQRAGDIGSAIKQIPWFEEVDVSAADVEFLRNAKRQNLWEGMDELEAKANALDQLKSMKAGGETADFMEQRQLGREMERDIDSGVGLGWFGTRAAQQAGRQDWEYEAMGANLWDINPVSLINDIVWAATGKEGGYRFGYLQPVFQDLQDDTALESFAKGVVNAIPSVVNIASDVGNLVLQTDEAAEGIWHLLAGAYDKARGVESESSQVVDLVWDDLKRPYTSMDNFKQVIVENPARIAQDILTLVSWGAAATAKWAQVAKATNTAQKASRIAQQAARLDPVVMWARPALDIVKGVAQGASQWVWVAGRAAWSAIQWSKNVAKSILSKVSGLDEATIDTAINSPELMTKAQKGDIDVNTELNRVVEGIQAARDDVKNLGAEYEALRQSGQEIDISGALQPVQDMLRKKNISINPDGTLDFSKSAIKNDASDMRSVQQAYKDITDQQVFTVDEYLNRRQAIDSLRDYKSEVSSKWDAIVRDIRRAMDAEGHKIEWLKALDAKYAPIIEDVNRILKDFYNKDGTLKDNAISKVNNLLSQTNQARLERVKQFVPDIEENLRVVKAAQDLQAARQNKVGTYMNAWAALALGTTAWLWPAGLVAAMIITNPTVITNALKTYGRGKQFVKSLSKKIDNNEVLTDAEIDRVVKELPEVVEEAQSNLSQ